MILTHILKNKNEEDFWFALGIGMLVGLFVGLIAYIIINNGIETDTQSLNSYAFWIIFILSLLISLGIGSDFKSMPVGLIVFLSIGLTAGLIGGIFPWANYYPTFIPIWFLVIAGLLLTEIFFWLTPIDDKSSTAKKLNKKQQKKKFGKTILLKLECLFEVFVLLNMLNIARLLISNITLEMFKAVLYWILHTGLVWLGYIGGGAIAFGLVIFILYLWIKLNARKFE